jgi:hypothetical protein
MRPQGLLDKVDGRVSEDITVVLPRMYFYMNKEKTKRKVESILYEDGLLPEPDMYRKGLIDFRYFDISLVEKPKIEEVKDSKVPLTTEQIIEKLESRIAKDKARLNSISMKAPICRNCKSTKLSLWGHSFKCMDCAYFTSKDTIKYKRIPR